MGRYALFVELNLEYTAVSQLSTLIHGKQGVLFIGQSGAQGQKQGSCVFLLWCDTDF